MLEGIIQKAREASEGLELLRGLVGNCLCRGILLYTDQESVPFGTGLHALPVGAPWRT